uniref:Fibroblast growth factor binding protein 1a n=1 Tax=Scophthalmus maximus TaxID=52904 RepID=A0A8D3A808_SCOMX
LLYLGSSLAGLMAFFTNVTILLVLACVSHQLMSGSCQKGHGRRGRGADRGHGHKDRSGPKVGRPPKAASAQPIKGKLVTKDKSECTWAAAGDDLLVLGATCRKGGASVSCEYVARPSLCPRYASNVELYWKQIARALKKQRNLCRDSKPLVRAGMCRGAARGRTTAPPRSPPTAAAAAKSCQPGNKKLAEEYCSDSWSSFCTFFFTMVKDDDC